MALLLERDSSGPISWGQVKAGFWDSLAATRDETFAQNPLNQLRRIDELGSATAIGDPTAPEYVAPTMLPAADARARAQQSGVKLKISDQGITEHALDVLITRQKDQQAREKALTQGPDGFAAGAARLGVAFAASAMDPLNLASAFVPIIPEARAAAWLAERGMAARTGIRAGVGAAEGAVGQALLEPLALLSNKQDQADYTMGNSLQNIAFGGLFGSGVHILGGALMDAAGRGMPAPRAPEAPRGTTGAPFEPSPGPTTRGEPFQPTGEPGAQAINVPPGGFSSADPIARAQEIFGKMRQGALSEEQLRALVRSDPEAARVIGDALTGGNLPAEVAPFRRASQKSQAVTVATKVEPKIGDGMSFTALGKKSDELQARIDVLHDELDAKGVDWEAQKQDPRIKALYEERIAYDTAAGRKGYNGAKNVIERVLRGMPDKTLYASHRSILAERYSLTENSESGAYMMAKYTGKAIDSPATIEKLSRDIAKLIFERDYPGADYFASMESALSGLSDGAKAKIVKEAHDKAVAINEGIRDFFLGKEAASAAPDIAAKMLERKLDAREQNDVIGDAISTVFNPPPENSARFQIGQADWQTRQAAFKTALGQAMDGKQINVDPVFGAAPGARQPMTPEQVTTAAERQARPESARVADFQAAKAADARLAAAPKGELLVQAEEMLAKEEAKLADTLKNLQQSAPLPLKEIGASSLSPQAQGVLQKMYVAASAFKPGFDAALRQIAAATGGTAKLAELKGIGRTLQKIASDYSGDPKGMKDILRGTVEVESAASAQAAIAAIKKNFKVLDKGQRNLLDPAIKPIDGYRDAKFNVDIDGHVAEVQVNLPEMLAAKKQVHKQYEQRSEIERKYAGKEMPAEAQAKIDALNAEMRAVYEPAWASATSASKAGSETGAPLRRADSGSNGRGGSESQHTENGTPGQSGLSETGMPSTSNSSAREPNSGNFMATSDSVVPENGPKGNTLEQRMLAELKPFDDAIADADAMSAGMKAAALCGVRQ